MRRTVFRAALYSSASIVLPAVPAAFLLPAQAAAQTACTLAVTAGSITCVNGTTTVATGVVVGATSDVSSGGATGGLQYSFTPGGTLTLTPVGGTTATFTSNSADGNSITSTGADLQVAAGTTNFVSTAGTGLVLESTTNVGTATTAAAVGNLSSATDSALVVDVSGLINVSTGTLSGNGNDVAVLQSTGGNVTLVTGTVTGGSLSGTDGVIVGTSGAGNVNLTTGNIVVAADDGTAVLTFADTGSTVINAGTITTTGAIFSDGIVASSNTGAVTITSGAISTTGSDSEGIYVATTTGDITLNIAGITATGAGSEAIEIDTAGGDVVFNQATGTTVSSNDPATDAVVVNGAATVSGTLRTISALGADSRGLNLGDTLAVGTVGTGTAALAVGNVTATEEAIFVNATGNVNIAAGNLASSESDTLVADVTTTGASTVNLTTGTISASGTDIAGGLVVDAGTGAVTVNTGAVSTVGTTDSTAVYVTSSGNQTITVGNVTTTGTGDFNEAILFDRDAAGTTTIVAGNLSTVGGESEGVYGNVTGGTVNITTGTITTAGATSEGVQLLGTAAQVNVQTGNVTTSGADANALDIDAAGTVTFNNAAATTLRTNAANTTAVLVDANGVSGTLGNVTTAGVDSQGVIINSLGAASPVNLTIGNVATTDNGVIVNAGANNVTLTTGTVTATEVGAGATQINSTGTVVFTGGLQTSNTADALQINGGAGPISATVAGATTTGANADGVQITGTGPLTLFNNTGTITTTGAGSRGVVISGVTTANVATCGNITTSGAGATAFDLTANGNTTVTCGTIVTNGANADGINVVNTAGTTTVTGTNTDVNGENSIGIDVTTTGTGAVAVNTGIVTQDGANTLAVPSFAAVRVVAADVAPVTVVANGLVDSLNGAGIWAQTAGAATVTINSGAIVEGGTTGVVLGGTTANTLNVNGTVRSSTAGNNAFLTAAGAGPATVNVGATGVVTGRFTLSGGNDVVNNLGSINSIGVLDFGAGADTFANGATGILNLTGNTTLTGLETLTNAAGGRLQLNNFTLTGPAIAFTNAGTIDTSGNASLLGITALNNTGTIDLAAGTFTVPAIVFTNTGTILADEGASTITGQTNFANSGTIDLQDGATGDVLTINSTFVGSGGSNLLVDFGDDVSDRLVLTGAASGTTAVNANFVGVGLIDLDGVLVVDGTTATANAFTLGTIGGNTSPLINYSLVQAGGDFLLVSTPDQAVFDPLSVPALGSSLWYQSADEVIAQTRLPAETVGASFWGQVYLSRDEWGDTDGQTLDGVDFEVDNELETKRHGIQLGVDFGFVGGRVGLTGGLARAKADGGNDIGLKAKGWNVGVYGQFGGPVGFHGEALLKTDRYDLDFNNGFFDGESSDVKATGVDGSVGYRFGMGGDSLVDVNAGVSRVRTSIDSIAAFGFNYDINRINSTRGRAGVRATFGQGLSPYVDATVYHEFGDDFGVDLFDGANVYGLETGRMGTYVRLEGGVAGRPTGPLLSAWADLGDRKGFGFRAGFRFGGAAAPVEMLPPPPPPPAPAAPETQTCADGSVILATDACPPPPPPPPPPPAPSAGERG